MIGLVRGSGIGSTPSLSHLSARTSLQRQTGLQIRALKFQRSRQKFPRARTCELHRARSRRNRSQILQVNTRWKALAEIYTMYSFDLLCTVLESNPFAPFSNLNFFVKNRQHFFAIELMNFINSIAKNSNFAFFCEFFMNFFLDFAPNSRKE